MRRNNFNNDFSEKARFPSNVSRMNPIYFHALLLFRKPAPKGVNMQFVGTSFQDYALDEFLKVQLLFDDSFKYFPVSTISEIPQSPHIGPTAKSMFHKGSVLLKSLQVSLSELSDFNAFPLNPEFSQNIYKFYTVNKNTIFKNFTVDGAVTGFQQYLTGQKGLTTVDVSFYVQMIQFIDLMLLCKSNNDDKATLTRIRSDFIKCSYLKLPDITDVKFKKSVCQTFQISELQLESRIDNLRKHVSKQKVLNYFNSDYVLSKQYNVNDFEKQEYYENWIQKASNLEYDMKSLFEDPNFKHTAGMIIPNQLEDLVSLLLYLTLNSSSSFFQGIIKCMQIWQVNPFLIQRLFIEVATSERIDPELVEKALNLSYLAMPFQVQYIEWPLIEKRKFLSKSMEIYDQSFTQIQPFFSQFFNDQKSFTTVLSFLKLLKLDLKNVKTEINQSLSKSITGRLSSYTSKLETNSKSHLKIESVVIYLSRISKDVNMLYNWKTNNKDLNITYGIFELGSKILMTPVLDVIKTFVAEMKTNNFNLIADKDTRANFGTFIDLVNNLKSRTNFKYDFQKEIYPDFYKVVTSWSIEMVDRTKIIVQNDDLTRLPGCSYSSGIQNLIMLFEGYIKLLDSFEWRDLSQSAELNKVLYKSMVKSLRYYHDSMLSKIKELNALRELNDPRYVGAMVCLNNIYQVFEFLQTLETNENVHKVSEYLITSGKHQDLKERNRYVTLFIQGAENLEDMKGRPISSKVKLSGLMNGETRTILKDYNPEWLEKFNTILPASKLFAMIKLDLIDVGPGNSYKSVEYRIDLTSESTLKNHTDTIKLVPRSGTLNIGINVEFEKTDPLFYILNFKNTVESSIDRCINYLIENYIIDFKNVLTREYLEESLINFPVKSENDYKRYQDPVIDKLVGDFQVKVIPQLYDNLETKTFDKLIVEFWKKLINIAENLILPRISILNSSITTKLNKKASGHSAGSQVYTTSDKLSIDYSRLSLNSGSRSIYKTTRDELIRVVEWCYKLRSMIDLPDMILQDDTLNQPFQRFNEIKHLFNLSIDELKTKYYQEWNYLNKNMLRRYSKELKYDAVVWENATQSKELVLRILLAHGELKFVKSAVELEHRFERIIKTEVQVSRLQQYL